MQGLLPKTAQDKNTETPIAYTGTYSLITNEFTSEPSSWKFMTLIQLKEHIKGQPCNIS